jgi:GntR family transcriptional regulator, rspAB operon transcriptional repressor
MNLRPMDKNISFEQQRSNIEPRRGSLRRFRKLAADPPRLLFKSQRIYLELRRKIADLELAPGTILDWHAVASEHNASRTPVREAFARLAGEHLVVIRRGRSVVAPISADHVRESLFVRMALEIETSGRASVIMSSAVIERLRANLNEQRTALEQRNVALFAELDEKLHSTLFDAVACPRAKRTVAAAVAAIARIRRLCPPSGERLHDAFVEHCWIVDALATQNPHLAAAAMRAHLTNDGACVERSLRDFFAQGKRVRDMT